MPDRETESRIKKRARDRRAQQNLRDKRLAHVDALEQRIVALEGELQILQQTCYGLRRENEVLLGRHEYVRHIVTSWNPHNSHELGPYDTARDPPLGAVGSTPQTIAIRPGQSGIGADNDRKTGSTTHPDTHQVPSVDARTPTTQVSQPSPGPLGGLTLPQWNMIPAHVEGDRVVTDCFSICLKRPDLVRASPENPQPVEFLFGSKTNFLANVMHDLTRHWPCRDPERLAMGWLSYHLVRWISAPSEERFSRLQDFQKPVDEQLCQSHPYFADFALWPTFRANLIKHQHTYEIEDVIGLTTCCLKVRWPWNKPFLEPGDDGQLAILPDFYNTFTRLEGWGLTKEFSNKYPELIAGLDPALIHYEIC
ncbi:hypothetical protein GGR54DRAFT_24886 [Hypoxylon sp. NC1633]|nr:hypothetical protein GGR54DRAFT_24886 [Hypoxylon sp. NC1633]